MNHTHEIGQYFTTNTELKAKVYEFIQNNPDNILEPSIGQGDLVTYIMSKNPNIIFDMYEIDPNIKLLDGINMSNIVYGDFLTQPFNKLYKTIVGNPPYVKTKKGNLYIDFIKKCFYLLEPNGELIFIIPSDFFKLTSASKILNSMMVSGTFTHIYHPHNERLFENASVDVIVFRYCKNHTIEKKVLYNEILLNITNTNGLVTFEERLCDGVVFSEYFDVYVGLVSGKEDVFKNKELGNIDVLNSNEIFDKYIYVNQYPCDNNKINEHLLRNKDALIKRGIRKFNENNWFEWGAPRNISVMKSCAGEECIYIHNLTRKSTVAFVSNVNYFGGGLIMCKPKKLCDLNKIVSFINSTQFKNQFMFSGRFKIGHRQISNSLIPNEYL